jgi:hypothetical protein
MEHCCKSIAFRKAEFEYNLCKIAMKSQTDFMTELNKRLKEENDEYTFNKKLRKHKKHFPASMKITCDECLNQLIKTQSKVTLSLSSKPITEQIADILLTATRRYNSLKAYYNNHDLFNWLLVKHSTGLPILTPFVLRHNLIKYDENDIRNKFPTFCGKDNKPFFDTIYAIKTENSHKYIDVTNKKFCDTILICFCDKIFNIIFDSDELHPYHRYLPNNYSESQIKELYNNAMV